MTRARRLDSVLQRTVSRREVARRAAIAGLAAPAIAAGLGARRAAAAQDQDLSATLTVWGWEASVNALKVVEADFAAAYPNLKVEYEVRPPTDTYQQLQLAASAGSGGPDIAIIEDSNLAQYAQLGALADLTDRVAPYRDKMNDYKWLQADADGRTYAMPWDSGPVALFYRRDVFERAGVDPAALATWEDYYQAARTIKQATGAAMLQLAKARTDARTFEMLLWQRGLGYVDADGAVVLDTEPRVLETLEYLGRFWREDLALDTEAWTDPWYKAYGDGTVATAPAAVWLGTFFKSFIAPDAVGVWGRRRCRPGRARSPGSATTAGRRWRSGRRASSRKRPGPSSSSTSGGRRPNSRCTARRTSSRAWRRPTPTPSSRSRTRTSPTSRSAPSSPKRWGESRPPASTRATTRR